MFPKIGVPQNWCFIMENLINMGWFGGTIIFGNIHIPRHHQTSLQNQRPMRNFMKLHPSTSWPQALPSTSPRVAGWIPLKVPIDWDGLGTVTPKKQPSSKRITFQWFHWYPGRPSETFCDLLLMRFLLEKDSFKESQPRLSTCLRSTSQFTCEPGPAFFFKQLLNGTLLNDWWGDKTRYW